MKPLLLVILLCGCDDIPMMMSPPTDDAGTSPADLTPPPDLGPGGPTCPTPFSADPHAAERAACTFAAGAKPASTLTLGAKLPLTHIVVVMQENRSFDHLFGVLPMQGQPEAEGWPAGYANPDKNNAMVTPHHLTTATLPADPPHQGAAMKAGWNMGMMNGFVRTAAVSGSDGHFVLGYYEQSDLPFMYWMANTFSLADHYFGSVLGGTWANRDYLYAGSSDGVLDTGSRVITLRSIFNALDDAKVPWGVYTDGNPRQDCMGWKSTHVGVARFPAFLSALEDGTLPAVTFVDPAGCQDQHPAADIHGGENWLRKIYEASVKSPLWPGLAVIITYDESGGMADHMPPPAACPPSADQSAFNVLGIRIPTIVISPWARRHHVSHMVHDHTSVLRLIETVWDLPALTARDANAEALLDMFDFACPPMMTPPAAPLGGAAICN